MKKLVLASTVIIVAALGWTAGAGAVEDKLYSIQVRAVPMAEKADGLATYRALRDKGYLVYAYKAEVKGKPWLRVAVGVFDSIDEAADFGKTFSAKEKQDHFVARAPVRITAGDGGAFVVTPSALWTRQGGKVSEVFVFDDPAPKGSAAPGEIRLKPSPDRKAVAFHYGEFGSRVYAVGLGDKEAKWLNKDAVGGPGFDEPDPRWSPSGRYIAFHDFLGWEGKGSLWLVRADGSDLRPLIDNRTYENNRALKGFVWHPTEDRIFFVDGFFHGSSPGGHIRSVDMEGNVKAVLEKTPGAHEEHNGPLRIEDGYLHYRKWRFDEKFDETITDERIPLSGL